MSLCPEAIERRERAVKWVLAKPGRSQIEACRKFGVQPSSLSRAPKRMKLKPTQVPDGRRN